jgi:hypothetical protein
LLAAVNAEAKFEAQGIGASDLRGWQGIEQISALIGGAFILRNDTAAGAMESIRVPMSVPDPGVAMLCRPIDKDRIQPAR